MDLSFKNDLLLGKRLSLEYEEADEKFIEFAFQNKEYIFCPCKKCLNCTVVNDKETIRDHFFCNGFDPSYKDWIWHGKNRDGSIKAVGATDEDDHIEINRLEEMVDQVVRKCAEQSAKIVALLKADNEKPQYLGCTRHTRLSGVLRLFHLKAANGWTDKTFSSLLMLLKDLLLSDNKLPDRVYEAKKILCPMGMEYKKIHACPNDCILFRHEFVDEVQCPKYGASRYRHYERPNAIHNEESTKKRIGSPAKVLWYKPNIPHFKRLFADEKDTKNLRWHRDRDIIPGDIMIRHASNGDQWKKFDRLYPKFGGDPRNLRFGLCTDGMNPFGRLSSAHSYWLVMLVIYNLPPHLCMKRKYIIMSMLISGPRQPGNDIDVYLTPLVEDLKNLWENDAVVYYAFRQEAFILRAMLFCTTDDFSTYENLSS